MGGRRRPALDPVSMIEAAYRVDGDDDDWLDGLLAAAAPLDRGLGMLAFSFHVPQGAPPRVLSLRASATLSDELRDGNRKIFASPQPPEVVAEYYGQSKCGTSSMNTGHDTVSALMPPGVRDAIGIVARDTSEVGCLVTVALPEVTTFPAPTVAVWYRIAAHMVAGLRVRRFLAASGSEASPEAILTPAGRVEHAEGPAASKRARDVLREGVVRIDRARSRLRRSSPAEAVELWQGLLAGRWSLMDHFDRDGRRYVFARRNDPEANGSPALSQRERQVLGYAALGHANKLIGYELGLSPTTVATHLGSGLGKLGLRTRVELIALWGASRGK